MKRGMNAENGDRFRRKQPIMTPSLRVIAPGLATTVQDEGRLGFQRYGVPVSGALDRIALAAANVTVGNPAAAAALECLYQGPTLEVAAEAVRVGVAGEGAAIEVLAAPARRAPGLVSVTLHGGDRFRVIMAGPSISAYMAVAGGIDVPLALGSRSTYARARLGGVQGRHLKAGDHIPLSSEASPSGPDQWLSGVSLAPVSLVHLIAGPQADRFTQQAHDTLTRATYLVQTASDRMGLRLGGERLEHVAGADIVSDAIAPGAIQVPGDGRPIIMLADRQTTGGYTKIATVISADLPGLGRVGPGAKLRFRYIDVAEAEQRRRSLDAAIANWPSRLKFVPSGATTADLETLMTANLVSGVIDGATDLEP